MARISIAAIVPHIINDARRRLMGVASAVANDWRMEARARLGVSGKNIAAYQRAVKVVAGPSEATQRVQLEGMLPNMFEQGMGPGGIGTEGVYDLRVFLLRDTTRHVRVSRAGNRYLSVPFSHSAAAIKALGGSSALRAAQQLAPTTTTMGPNGRSTSWGARLGAGHAPNLRPTGTPSGATLFDPHRGAMRVPGALHAHATDPLHGLVRVQTQYQGSTSSQSEYRTFRTISENGKPWWSPGQRARRLADAVVARLPTILGRVLGL